MPYTYIYGVWQTTAEKRRWMRKNCGDCFISDTMWRRVQGEDIEGEAIEDEDEDEDEDEGKD